MNKQTKWIIGIVILLLAIWGIIYLAGESGDRNQELSDEPIKIGAVLSLTGEAAVDSLNIQRGLDLARDDLSKKG